MILPCLLPPPLAGGLTGEDGERIGYEVKISKASPYKRLNAVHYYG
jgi:hypothetical protein